MQLETGGADDPAVLLCDQQEGRVVGHAVDRKPARDQQIENRLRVVRPRNPDRGLARRHSTPTSSRAALDTWPGA